MRLDAQSYWQSTAPNIPLDLDLPRTVDVAVIGGGLLGTATSYWLAREGMHVALLERSAIGAGATGRNGGFVVAGPAMPYPETIARLGIEVARAVMSVTHENRTLLRQVIEEENLHCEYREPGTIRLAITQERFEEQRQEVAMLQADGFQAELLDRKQLQESIKIALGPEIIGGRFLPEQGLLHSARFVRGLVRAAVRRGAHAYQAQVLALEAEGDHIRLTTTGGTLSAGAVVSAMNVWTREIIPTLKEVIMPIREQMLAYEPMAPIFSMGMSGTVITDEYWHQTPDGTLLIGGCGSVAPGDDMGIWEETPTEVVQQALEQVLSRLFPTLPKRPVKQRWAGLLDFTTDMHPIVDALPGIPHAWFVCGFSGHGMPFGLRFGQLLAQTVKNGEQPTLLRHFSLDRPTLKPWDQLSNMS